MAEVRVGGRVWDAEAAAAFVARYLTTPAQNWAYPAYDGYPGAPTDFVGPQDLFAPALLNAGLSLPSYYAFLDALDEINTRLADVPTSVDLADADAEQVASVARVIAMRPTGTSGSGATTNSAQPSAPRRSPATCSWSQVTGVPMK